MRVYRRGQSTSPNALSDSGVLQVTSSLSGMLDGECPDDKVAEMTKALLGCYGSVSATNAPLEYVLVECPPPDPRFKYVCISGSTFELNDGGATPVVVELEVKALYPF